MRRKYATKQEKQEHMTTKKYLRRIDRDMRWVEDQLNPDNESNIDWDVLEFTAKDNIKDTIKFLICEKGVRDDHLIKWLYDIELYIKCIEDRATLSGFDISKSLYASINK